MGVRYKHVSKRMRQRLAGNATSMELALAFEELHAAAGVRTITGPWYKPVWRGSHLLAYIVGEGHVITSVLSPRMTPRGERV